ncbi:ABC transporter six-transmembrane domain-containing protein [Ferruginibacter sp. SUN106]|uniref:ABC transporter six-transmembrane domain-containing protein n=1 Tax=Ferruginibacter sp. SUN106 TaxID=2978348 RepID=UPI003D36E8D4
MSRFQILKRLMNKHRSQLVLTYILFSLEMLGGLLRPLFLGIAINDLLKGSYQGLILLSAVHFVTLIVGTLRHMYDTRTYSAIYVSLVTKFLSRRVYKQDVSKLSAHSTLAREFVDFLEFDLVYVIEAVYNLFGSLILMFFYDASVVTLCLAVLIPVSGISYVYGKRMKKLNKLKNDELEQQVDVISSFDKKTVQTHYNNLRKWQIKISNQEAWNFGFMEFLVMIVLGTSLLLTYKTSHAEILAGNVVGIFFYVSNFAKGLETIPYTVQRLTSLTDITRRIELQVEDFPEDNNNLKPVRKEKRTKVGEMAA